MKNDPLGLFSDDSTNDPLGLFEDDNKPKGRTTFKEDIGIAEAGVHNTWSSMKGLVRGGVATALGDRELADEYYSKMERDKRKRTQAANPDGKEQGFLGKLFGVAATLPIQATALPFSSFDTGSNAIEAGESLEKAQSMAIIDGALNAVGLGIGGFGKSIGAKVLSSGGINAAQDTLARAAISGIADTKQIKEQYAPSFEDAAVAGVIGAPFGLLPGKKKTTNPDDAVIKSLEKEIADAANAAIPKKGKSVSQNDWYEKEKPVKGRPKAGRADPMQYTANKLADDTTSPGLTESPAIGRMTQDLNRTVSNENMLGNEANRTLLERSRLGPKEPDASALWDGFDPDQIKRGEIESMEQARIDSAVADGMRVVEMRRAEEAQRAIAERNHALEQEVQQRRHWEEEAKVRGMKDTGYEKWLQEQLNEKFRRLYDKEVDEKIRQSLGDAQGPIIIDPKGQAFRGDVTDPIVGRADRAQEFASAVETLHLGNEKMGWEGPKDGDPLRPLQDPVIQQAREDAKSLAAQMPPQPSTSRAADLPKGKGPITSKGKRGRQRGAITTNEMLKAAESAVKTAADHLNSLWSKIRIHHQHGYDALDDLIASNPAMVFMARQELKALGYGEDIDVALKDLQDAAKNYERVQESFNLPMEVKGKYNIVRKALDSIDGQIADLRAKQDAIFPPRDDYGREWMAAYKNADRGTKIKWRNLSKQIQQLEEKKEAIGLTSNEEKYIKSDDISNARDLEYIIQSADVKAAKESLPNTGGGSNNVRPFVPKGQRGGVTLDLLTLGLLPKKNPLAKMTAQKDGTFIPDNLTPEQVDERLVKAQTETDGRGFKNMASGADLEGRKRGSTLISTIHELVSGANKRAEHGIKTNVFPAEDRLKAIDRAQMVQLAELMKLEMHAKQRLSGDTFDKLSPKLQNAYRQMREMFNKALEVQNEARVAKGQKPIAPQEAYLSSRWSGDFRRPVFDTDGKLVWYLAAHTKAELNAQTRALLKDHPTLVVDTKKDHNIRFWNNKTDLESAYTTMLDVLGRDDPAVAKLQAYMETITVGQGASFLNQEKHHKPKGGVFGFVGDRPTIRVNDFFDKTIPVIGELPIRRGVENGKLAESEALKLFEQQIQYGKNSFRWSELQKVGDNVKKLLNDPELREKQPRNIDYASDYWKNSIGLGEHRAMRALADAMRDIGISPVAVDKGVSNLKSYFILSKLVANTGYTIAQAVQLGMLIPHMLDISVKTKTVPPLLGLKALSYGLLGGLVMGTGHMVNAVPQRWKDQFGIAEGKGKFPDIPNADFFNRAAKYAEDNSITARSIHDEAPLQNSFSKVGPALNAIAKTITVPETYMRSVAFMTMADFLRSTGKYTDEQALFKEAESRTNIGMTDYAASERPMMFQKLGAAGNFLNTLQTFSFNFYNQHSYFARELAKGNPLPFLAFYVTMYLIAGLNGVPGATDINDVWMAMKDSGMLSANTWRKIQENEFLSNPKLWLMKNDPASLVGFLSDKTGLGLYNRVSAPAAEQMLQSPGGPVLDIGKQAVAAGKAVVNPTQTNLAQSAMLSTPPGLVGLLEQADFMEGVTYNTRDEDTKTALRPTQLRERQGIVNRTPVDVTARKFGLRTTKEMLEREMNYQGKRYEKTAEMYARDVPTAFYDAIRRNDPEDAMEYYKTQVFLTGKGISKEQFESMVNKEFLTDRERTMTSPKRSLSHLANMKRMQETYEAIQERYGNENKRAR